MTLVPHDPVPSRDRFCFLSPQNFLLGGGGVCALSCERISGFLYHLECCNRGKDLSDQLDVAELGERTFCELCHYKTDVLSEAPLCELSRTHHCSGAERR